LSLDPNMYIFLDSPCSCDVPSKPLLSRKIKRKKVFYRPKNFNPFFGPKNPGFEPVPGPESGNGQFSQMRLQKRP
jgi:hypothetical protein